MRLLLHPSDQPIFRLFVRHAGCAIELRINDVPIYRDASGDAAAFEMPVNEWLFQGRNEIDVNLSPLEPGTAFDKSAAARVVLQHKAARDAQKNISDIGTLDWQPPANDHAHHHDHDHDHHEEDAPAPEDEDAPLLALPGQAEELTWRIQPAHGNRDGSQHVHTVLSLPPPWPVCPWERAMPLSVDQRYLYAVQQSMQTFAESLRMGGWQRFVPHRRAALATAYYLTEAAADEALSLQRLIQENWLQAPFPMQGLKLELAGHRRLARLVHESTNESPLVMVNEKEGIAATIDAWWMFQQNWVMIR